MTLCTVSVEKRPRCEVTRRAAPAARRSSGRTRDGDMRTPFGESQEISTDWYQRRVM